MLAVRLLQQLLDRCLNAVPVSLQAMQAPDLQVADYLQHLQGGHFLGHTPPEPLTAVHELLTAKADAWRSKLKQNQLTHQIRTGQQHGNGADSDSDIDINGHAEGEWHNVKLKQAPA